jgi:atlastin
MYFYIVVGPLQLLYLNKETKLFELDEAAVKSVLLQPQVRNRKIAIVSIVGAFRRGKSFLLNFMLRYLNAKVCP